MSEPKEKTYAIVFSNGMQARMTLREKPANEQMTILVRWRPEYDLAKHQEIMAEYLKWSTEAMQDFANFTGRPLQRLSL